MSTTQVIPTIPAVAFSRADPPTKAFRLASGMSTSTLSALTGIPIERIEALEAGADPLGDELTTMGRYLGIPADRLFPA